MRRRLMALLALAALAGGAGVIAFQRDIGAAVGLLPDRHSHAAFQDWLAEEPGRSAAFAEFTRFLGEQGVADVVPAWQLTRTDITRRIHCNVPPFLLPPRADWRNIVPVLRLVRDGIEPLVGEVEVHSSYRTPDFNTCVGGASRSRHLGFRALDLVAVEPQENRTLFTALCRFHRRHGARYDMGLGAYFNLEREGQNRFGRFHVDVSGYRSWGYSQHRESSACRVI
jgi:hypothetical protein